MSHTSSPSSKVVNGERATAGGSGNARQVASLRAALLAAVTPQDMQDVMAALQVQAKKGDVTAVRLFLAYAVGKPGDSRRSAASDDQEQIAEEVTDHRREANPDVLTAATADVPVAQPATNALDPEPPLAGRLNARARAELRRAERKRRKAERKQARQLELQTARPKAQRALAPSANAGIGLSAPPPIGANGPAVPFMSSV